MNTYFKIMTWLYLSAGVIAAGMTVFFQVKGMSDEAVYCLICVFVCGLMLGLRSWQRKRMEKLEKFMREKHEAEQREKSSSKKGK